MTKESEIASLEAEFDALLGTGGPRKPKTPKQKAPPKKVNGTPRAEAAPAVSPPAKPVVTEGYKTTVPPPHVQNVRTKLHWPTRHAPGSLNNGDSVWYRDERYYIANVPPSWEHTSYVNICSMPIRPNSYTPREAEFFFVHADLLDLAPVVKTIFHDQPTRSAIETQQRKKELGITDIGDDIGELLRGKSVDETYAIAAKRLRTPEDELRAKYRHLNPGQQRMVLGNRMRKQK